MKDKNYMSMQQVCILSYPKQCVHRQACGHSVRLGCQSVCVRVCVCHGETRRVDFFSPLSLPPSLAPCQFYIPPLYFPFLHAAPDVKAVKY